jgi:hypothetical protein
MTISQRGIRWRSAVGILAAVLSITLDTAAQSFTSSNLPIVVIGTNGQTIVNEPKITADMKVIYNGEGKRNALTDTVYHYKGKIGIEIRGSSSQLFPKKQYGIETRDSTGEDVSVSFFGMPAEADWILSAQYNDKSLMRDALTYSLSNAMGRYASRSRYCEVVINGEYRGVYMLFEKIKRDKNRVNISKLDSTGTTGDALTGGYIIKIDKLDGSGNEGFYSTFAAHPGSKFKILYQYHYPKPEDITAAQKTYIKNAVTSFEAILFSSVFADTVNGYTKYLDMPSMVDVFLINELSRNVDGYRLSSFLYKDRDSKNPKFFFGPVWDYNHGYGNCNYYDASKVEGWQIDHQASDPWFSVNDEFQPPFWWKKIFDEPSFKKLAAARWRTLRATTLSLPKIRSFVDSIAVLINEGQQRNFVTWPILNTYVWPNVYIGGTYANEVAYLKTWIMLRMDWMDKELTGAPLSASDAERPLPGTFALEQNYPNPFNPATVIRFRVPADQYGELSVYDVLGRKHSTPVRGLLTAGEHQLTFRSESFGSGIYFYRLTAGTYSLTKKMIITK